MCTGSAWTAVRVAVATAGLWILLAGGRTATAEKPAPNWEHGELRAAVVGLDVPRGADVAIAVDQDLSRIDAATVVVRDRRGRALGVGVQIGADARVEAVTAGATASLFKGEVVAIEPVYEAGGESKVTIRALNKLHRLTRGRKSRTFDDVTDADVVRFVATENGLNPVPSPELTIVHAHVYQHNQTDLEFLLERAARIGYEVLVDGSDLYFRRATPPANPVPVGPHLRSGPDLLAFRARLATSQTVQKVTVRGWDPVRNAEIVGVAAARTILLVPGDDRPNDILGRAIELALTSPVASPEGAAELARAELARQVEALLPSEAATSGHPDLKSGGVITIEGTDRRFEGKYYVVGTTHRFGGGGGGGYRTFLKVRRNAEALFFLPEVDDDVLVAFEHGDIRRFYVVGSLWDDDPDPRERPVR